MSYTTDLINKRRGQNISGSQIDGSQVDKKKSSEKITFTQNLIEQRRQNYDSFNTSRQNISDERFSISQPEPEKPGFFKKASDFLGIGTGELKQGAIGLKEGAQNLIADAGRRKQQGTLGSDIYGFGKGIFNSAKTSIVNEVQNKEKRKKEYFGEDTDLSKLNYDQIRDYQSDSFLDIIKPDLVTDLEKLESKQNKSKIDEYRIKNYKETLKMLDEAKNAPRDKKKNYDSFITGLALTRGTGALTAGILNIGESFFDFVKWRGDVAGTENISEFSEKAGDRVNQWADEVRPNNPQLADKLLEGVGSTLPFYVTGLGISSTTARLATVSPKMAQVIGVGSSAFMEAGLEAGTTYQSNIDRGMSHEEADKRASRVFAGNVLFNYFTDKVGIFNDQAGVKGFIMAGVGEGTQESWQNALQNIALDQEATEGMGETFMLSFITGAGLNSFGSVVQDPAVRQTLSEEDLAKLDAIDEAIRKSNGDPQKFEEALKEKGVKTDQTKTEDKPETKSKQEGTEEVAKTPSPVEDLNRPFSEENTKKTIEQSIAGEREEFRIDSEANIKKFTQGFGDAKPTDTVMVYRAGSGDIGSGEFVTTSKVRAEKVYIAQREGSKLLSKEVKISDLVHGGGLKSEFVLVEKEAKVSPPPSDRGEVAPGKDVKKVDAQSKRGEDGLVVGDIKPTREISNLVDGFSSSEKQIKKLEDILSLTSAVDDPKKFNKIEGEIDKIETGNRNAVKQISKKLNVSEFEVTTALSEFIDIGSRRGKTTLTDFYNFFRKDIAVKETPKEKTQREEGLKTKTDAKNEVVQSLTGELKSSKRGEEKTKPEVKNGIETLPKDVSVDEEAKAVGAKRIAPDRTVHQQLTPTESIKKIKSSISESIDILDKSRPVKASKNVIKQFNDVEVKVERGTATEAEKKWYDRVKDQMKVAKAYAELKELVGSKDIGKTELLEKARAMLSNEKAISNYYIKLIKKDISKGYKFPEAVISYDRSFTKAENNRARYEKGLATSFSADDSRIVFDDRIVGGLKRQDGNIITKKQIDEIVDGILQTQEALGIDMNKIAKDERWVYAHLNGKNPFLTAQAGGLYRKGANNISISIGGVEGFWTKVDGKKVRKKVNTTIAHELGHALDYHTDLKLFSRNDLFELRRGYNPVEYAFRGDKYWSSNVEITARAIEQYVAIENGHEAVYEREAYWKKEVYDSKIKPMVKEAIDKHFSEYQGTPITPEKIKQEVAPVKEEVVEKPVPKKELDKLEEKIVEQKEPEVKPKEKPKKKYEAQEPGQIKASKVAVSIEQKLGEKLENIAGFESINIKDQLKKAEDLLNKNLIRARGMISGKIPLPDGLRAGAFVVAVEEYAKQTNDMSLLRSLAVSPLVSETSIHAQELRLLAERDRDSVLSKMQEIANERAKVAERKYGSKVDKLIKEETKKVKESIKKVDKHLWKDFLKNIEC